MRFLKWLVCGLVISAAAQGASAKGADRWIQSWGAAPAGTTAAPGVNPMGFAPGFENQTIIQVVRLSAGGGRLRVRFSNEYGSTPLRIGAAQVTQLNARGEAVPGGKPLTFSGKPSATIPPGAPLLSDPVELQTASLAKLQVAIYLPEKVMLCTCHQNGAQKAFVSPPGDFTEKSLAAAAGATVVPYRAFLTGVEVEAGPAPVIVAFGDSITDGYRASDDADRRWPDRLAERLLSGAGSRPIGVVNAGISGNRVLNEGRV
ncbi:MAG: GDSL-type esterase/lipase family protein, partial [Betaproteobacteria bacterium]